MGPSGAGDSAGEVFGLVVVAGGVVEYAPAAIDPGTWGDGGSEAKHRSFQDGAAFGF